MKKTDFIKSRMSEAMYKQLKKDGWKVGDFFIEKKHKGFPLVIEFCIGDFCTYPCSKKNHWLLEPKYRAPSIIHAFNHVIKLQERIDAGEHWKGEED